MTRKFLLLAGAMFAAAAAASAALPRAGETILAGCRQGECAWMRVIAIGEPRRFPQGVLRGIDVRRGRSVHLDGTLPSSARQARIEWQDVAGAEYAFCSTRRPAYAFGGDDGLLVHFFDPFDLAGYQYSSAALYMRVCHGFQRLPSARTMRRLGYRPGTRSEQVENGSVATLTRF